MPATHVTVTNPSSERTLIKAFAAIREEFKLPQDFSPEVLQDTQRSIEQYRLPDEDATDLPFITIDPEGSMDLDQALYLEENTPGYTVHYAIADVPHFVNPGGALDAETRQRTQTIYLPDARIPLHPQSLSEDAASLIADQVRGAYVWRFDLDADGAVQKTSLRRARIKSIAKLNYVQCQAWIDGSAPPPEDERILPTLTLLKTVGLKRVELENLRGGASLNIPDQEIEYDGGRYSLRSRPALPVEAWNAQISLMTGMEAAQLMLDAKIGILRTMPEPTAEAIAKFRLQTQVLNAPWPEDMQYGAYLRTLDPENPQHLAILVAATSLFRGVGYTPFDGTVPEDAVQSAIGAPYAHTTAPLRRLVDRFVLALCLAIASDSDIPDWVRQALPELPKLMGRGDQIANAADRAAIDAVEAALLRDRVGEVFDAVVINGSNGKDAGEKPRVTIQIAHPPVAASATGSAQAGTRVKVKLESADILARTVTFTIQP